MLNTITGNSVLNVAALTPAGVTSKASNVPGHVVIEMPEGLLADAASIAALPADIVIGIDADVEGIWQEVRTDLPDHVRIDVDGLRNFLSDRRVECASDFGTALESYSAGRSTQTVEDRVQVVVDFFRDVWNTDFLSNLRTSALINMPSVFALTLARGFLASALSASVSGTAAVALGAAVTALPLILTAAAVVHHEYNASATPAYRASQLAFLAGSGAILTAAMLSDPVAIFGGLSGAAPAVALYCLSRDVYASFHGLGSDTALSLPANLIDALSYGAMQFSAGAAVVGMEAGLASMVVSSALNAVIETVEPALNEAFSQWMSERPEAQQQPDDDQAFRLGFNVSLPGWQRLVERLENTGIPRMTAFSMLSAGVATATTIGSMTGLSDSNQYWLANGVGALMATYILTPFYQSHALQSVAPTATTASTTPNQLAEVVVV
ncbi:hypothetical protein DM813_25400 [Pseudomonas alkylphenolica]|uniref:Uncharacterized protein n=1 Tax=Pseudomonas alkylphenolica TaxID=237609 RepID=A0A443ZGJ7_9PSED|nr:hypothetical protein [Pseudomonas alkylphenolica]RWU18008.1 hypothetical protein DM813_25400 [Pseudomonas alkylphenolica]